MAQQQTPMYMKDWIAKLDLILQMNGRELLTNAGKSLIKWQKKSLRLNIINIRMK